MTVTISTRYNTATDPPWDNMGPVVTGHTRASVTILTEHGKIKILVTQRGGEDVVTILRATARHTKWRKLYEGPLPADENVIFQTFAAMAAKRLSDE